ncbi:MAG TPA: PAS domain-containing protein, partial [Planctomycetaceae bacterium]|nr:PAS domain-containing protein [Planctomycetaceae bacterium]
MKRCAAAPMLWCTSRWTCPVCYGWWNGSLAAAPRRTTANHLGSCSLRSCPAAGGTRWPTHENGPVRDLRAGEPCRSTMTVPAGMARASRLPCPAAETAAPQCFFGQLVLSLCCHAFQGQDQAGKEYRMAGSSEQPGANRLLIVEDDAAERRVLAAMFQGEGFDVTACGSASEAFEQLARRRFAAAVVDLRLPDLAEQEFLERLSTVARDVPLVIYTAYGSYEAAKEAINCGARAFVEKAGDPEELIRRVHQAVRTCLEQRARLLEQAVAERTRELEEANRALRREVEERQRVEDELRLRDHAVEVSSEGISITDARQPDHPVIYVNRGFQRITGYSAAEIVGKKLPLLEGPETDSAAAQKLRDAMRRGHECCVELLNYRKDGTPFWNRVSITPVRDKEGDLTHFIGVHHDVTEAKQGDRFRRLTQFSVDKSADAALWIAADGRILYGNQSACRLVGVSLNQLLQL